MTDIVERTTLGMALEIESLRIELAECQAREKVLRDALDTWDQLIEFQYNGTREAMTALQIAADEGVKALAMPSDSTALDTMLAAAELKGRREALLEIADELRDAAIMRGGFYRYITDDELREKAKELE
jgi:hypothetical protein